MLPLIPLRDPSPAGRFACIIDNLCAALAHHLAKHPALRPLLMLAWTRLRRASARFTRLAARIEAGTLPTPRPHKPRDRTPRPPPPLRLPSGRSWLNRLVPGAAAFGSQLQYLLSEPDMQALLAAAPRAARIFRPLCRALGATPHPPLPPPPRRTPHPEPPAANPRPRPAQPRRGHPPRLVLGSFILPKPART